MLIVFDIGNTHITIGLFENKKLNCVSRIATNSTLTGDQYAVEINNILSLRHFSSSDVTDAVISSVVPAVGLSVNNAVNSLFNITPLVIGAGIKTGLNLKVENPAGLGGDLVAGAVAASELYTLPAIIFDFGTATKISVITKNKSFIGCAIMAGINISIDALASRTAALSPITLEMPKNIIGVNSAEAMKSGLIYGNASMIDGMAERIEKELGEKTTLLLTGGLAHLLKGHTKRDIIYSDNLLLEGLRIVFEKNRPEKSLL